jgi:hypothetical protein
MSLYQEDVNRIRIRINYKTVKHCKPKFQEEYLGNSF